MLRNLVNLSLLQISSQLRNFVFTKIQQRIYSSEIFVRYIEIISPFLLYCPFNHV